MTALGGVMQYTLCHALTGILFLFCRGGEHAQLSLPMLLSLALNEEGICLINR